MKDPVAELVLRLMQILTMYQPATVTVSVLFVPDAYVISPVIYCVVSKKLFGSRFLPLLRVAFVVLALYALNPEPTADGVRLS